LLCYALEYSEKKPEQLAALYCEYKKRLGHSFYYANELEERYSRSDKLTIFRDEFAAWFGLSSGGMGGRVSRLAFLALDWDHDAILLIDQVRSEGIAESRDLLQRYATGKASSKWIQRVLERANELEIFREADWVIEKFLPPEEWIVEERRITSNRDGEIR
jgi:hypothetical protein